jgi:hypothetical protein
VQCGGARSRAGRRWSGAHKEKENWTSLRRVDVVGAKADGDETADGRKPVARRSALDNGQ